MRVAFSERELDVMAVLWEHGPSTVTEVRDRLADGGIDLAYNSVLSVLRVLEEKGHADHEVEGKAHRYFALVDRAHAGRSAISRLLDTVFAGSSAQLLTHLVRDERVGRAEVEELRRMLDERLDELEEPRPRGRRSANAQEKSKTRSDE